MVEKNSRTVLAAILATLGLFGVVTTALSIHSTLAISSDTSSTTNILDRFGIQEIYPTKDGREWYVNMDNPVNDPNLRNLNNINFSQNPDGSWRVSAGQIRMETWSPESQKWQNIEMTEYAKIVSGSNELLQMYSRGGHHTSKDPCLGSAYKARLYGNGEAAWVKEVTHPAYSGNRGTVQATESLQGKWIGFKAVIYNVVGSDGKTYVRLESYIDDSVTDANGNLVIKNNWKLASVVEDKGGWATSNSDFDSQCGRARDAILTGSGGTATQNIAAFRSDDLTWDFKYLSVREIDPLKQEQVPQPVTLPTISNTTIPNVTEENNDTTVNMPTIVDSNPIQNDCVHNMTGCTVIANQHFANTNMTSVNAVSMQVSRVGDLNGEVIIAVSQDGHVLGSGTYGIWLLEPYTTTQVTVPIDPVVEVQGKSFDITILTKDKPEVAIDNISGQSST